MVALISAFVEGDKVGVCITVKDLEGNELAVIRCNADKEHILFLRSFVKSKTGKDIDLEYGELKVNVCEIWNALKNWVVRYIKHDNVEAAQSILFSMKNLQQLYAESPHKLVKLVWDS